MVVVVISGLSPHCPSRVGAPGERFVQIFTRKSTSLQNQETESSSHTEADLESTSAVDLDGAVSARAGLASVSRVAASASRVAAGASRVAASAARVTASVSALGGRDNNTGGLSVAGVARLDDGAGAVGDGQGGRTSDGVRLALVEEGGGIGAEGGVDVHDTGDVDGAAVAQSVAGGEGLSRGESAQAGDGGQASDGASGSLGLSSSGGASESDGASDGDVVASDGSRLGTSEGIGDSGSLGASGGVSDGVSESGRLGSGEASSGSEEEGVASEHHLDGFWFWGKFGDGTERVGNKGADEALKKFFFERRRGVKRVTWASNLKE